MKSSILLILFSIISLVFYPNEALAYSGLSFPVAYPSGTGYYDAQDYGVWNESFSGYHLGEDWNKQCGGDCDLGDSLYSIGDGRVIDVAYRRGWGNVVLIQYNLGTTKINALYGHLKDVGVRKNMPVESGELIGTIGKGDRNRFPAHLHFEIRNNLSISFGFGYGGLKPSGWVDPSEFIKANRPVSAQEVTLTAPEKGKVNITWEAATSDQFDSYNLYRAEVVGGTAEESKRKLIFSSKEKTANTFMDTDAPGPKTYYYTLHTVYKNGQVGVSAEKSIEQKGEVIQLTSNKYSQRYPSIFGNKIFWQDERYEEPSGQAPQKLFYYDLEQGKEAELIIGNQTDNARGARAPVGNAEEVCYYLTDRSNKGMNVYCYDFETNSYNSVIKENGEQYEVKLSEEGIVVWTDTRSGNNDIYYLDLRQSNGPQPLVVASGSQSAPAIWKNKVAWRDGRRGGNKFDLYIREIGGAEKKIADDVGSTANPSIWEDYVTWEKGGKIHLKNLRTDGITIIEETKSYNPKIRDGKIVYEKQETDVSYIWIHKLDTGTKTRIESPIMYKWFAFPAIYQDSVVWAASEKADGTDMNIFMTKV